MPAAWMSLDVSTLTKLGTFNFNSGTLDIDSTHGAGTTVRVDDLPMPPDRVQRRIAILSPATSGKLVVTVRLT